MMGQAMSAAPEAPAGAARAHDAFDECVGFRGGTLAGSAVEVSNDRVVLDLVRVRAVPSSGSGLRLKVRLPVGAWVVGDARVEASSHDGAAQCGRVAATWTRLGAVDRQLLRAAAGARRGSAGHPSTVEIKHWIERDEPGAVAMVLGGHLLEADCHAIDEQLATSLDRREPASPRLFLNATAFRASPSTALRRLGCALGRLGAFGPVRGVLVRGESVASAQLRRLLREVGLGERLVPCGTLDEARAVWKDA